jgi:hypothetical protein
MVMKARQYTIRNVPPSVDRELRKKAAEKKTSLNTLLLTALQKEAGIGSEPQKHHDLDHLIGSWIADPAVDRALSEQRKVDPKDWDQN